MRRSRLSKKNEAKNLRTIFLSIIGIILVIYILLKFGLATLVNISLFLSGKNNQNQAIQNQINFISAPILNPLPNATNSAKINVTGKSIKDITIKLYLNNLSQDQTETDGNGNFTFSINLEAGDNQIKTLAEKNGKKSDFSNVLSITFKNSKPNLSISSPTDGQTFKKDQNSVNVTGTTDPGTTITVNGFWAIIDESNNFSYILPLQNGDNQIKVVANDQAGNQTEKNIKVNYSQ